MMAELKTQPNDLSVEEFILSIEDEKKRDDSFYLVKLMSRITQADPVMWGSSIVGFGAYHYKYASGREGDWFLSGFSPRKQALSLYLMSGLSRHSETLQKLGKYKTGKGCLYVKKLEDVDLDILTKLIEESVAHLRNQ